MEIDLRDHFATHSPFTLGDAIEVLKVRLREQGEEEPKVGVEQAIQYLTRMNYVYADNMMVTRSVSNQPEQKEEKTTQE